MAVIPNNSTTGTVTAALTRAGRRRRLEGGKLNVTHFRLFDTEINYRLISPDNVDNDDPNILAQTIFEPNTDERSSEFSTEPGLSFGVLLNSPYFVRRQQILSGNRIVDSEFFAKDQETVVDLSSLSANSDLLSGPTSFTGTIISPNVFYSINVIAVDQNQSVINGTKVSLYNRTGLYDSRILTNVSNVIFTNLTAGTDYQVIVQNQGYGFSSPSGTPTYDITLLNKNYDIKFIGTAVSLSAVSYTVSGQVTNAITSVALSGIAVTLHYSTSTVTASTNSSGNYSFSAGVTLSGNTQVALAVNNNNLYYWDHQSLTTTANLQSNFVVNFPLFPRSQMTGNVYYLNTTNPISNATLNLYVGLSAATGTNRYVQSTYSRQDGSFVFDQLLLQKNYNLNASLQGFRFVNTPLQFASSSVTSSLSSIVIYGQKDERPVILDSPFPRRRRKGLDKSDLPIFFDQCSWAMWSLKPAYLVCSTDYRYGPVQHEAVLRSTNYASLIQSLAGPYTFTFNSTNQTTNGFGQPSLSAYVSDNYTVRIALYVMPYQYSLAQNVPQWDEFSLTDRFIPFPQQVNGRASDVQKEIGDKLQLPDAQPIVQSQSLGVSLADVNKVLSLLPRQTIYRPVELSVLNSLPAIGLFVSNSLNIDGDILNVSVTPNELFQNGAYTSVTSIKGDAIDVPFEVVQDSFIEVPITQTNDVITNVDNKLTAVPLPIVTFADSFLNLNNLANNLRWTFGLDGFESRVRSDGMVFNQTVKYSAEASTYTVEMQSPAISIGAFGQTRTMDDFWLTQNGNHYTVSQDFQQFLIGYFGISRSDQQTMSALTQNQTLADWVLYFLVLNAAAFRNSYLAGTLIKLIGLNRAVKRNIIEEFLRSGKNVAELVQQAVARSFAPQVPFTAAQTQQASLQTPQTAQSFQPQPTAAPSQNSFSAPNAIAGTGGIQTPLNQITQTTSLSPVNQQSFNQTGGSAVLNQTQTQVSQLPVLGDYSFFMQELSRTLTSGQANLTVNTVFGLVGFDFNKTYTIRLKRTATQTVSTTVQQPTKVVKVSTVQVSPIITKIINIAGANNFFNANTSLTPQITMTLNFDTANAHAQDTLIKTINYLNDRMYTTFLGVEINDNGNLTKTLNSSVYTTSDFTTGDLVTQKSFCTTDKNLFLIPLTTGGVVQTMAPSVLGDPTTFTGRGFVGLVPLSDQTAYIVRIVALSDVDNQLGILDPNVVSGSDFVTLDVIQIDNWKAFSMRTIARMLQVLKSYTYNTAQADLVALRQALNVDLPNAGAAFSYIGSFGPAFANSTRGPNFWSSPVIEWPVGASPLFIINKLTTSANGQILNVTKFIPDATQFTLQDAI